MIKFQNQMEQNYKGLEKNQKNYLEILLRTQQGPRLKYKNALELSNKSINKQSFRQTQIISDAKDSIFKEALTLEHLKRRKIGRNIDKL